jgi:glycosyltransferase involved in cell wall biosynthesis
MKQPPLQKIAIVHDWFTTYAGSEKVVEQILAAFPQADLFGLVDFIPAGSRGFLLDKPVRTSFLQTFPFLNQKNYRQFLPLMPLAVEQFDLSGYQVVISSCHAVSKGIITGPEQLHLSYLNTPMRYAWDMQNAYLENSGMSRLKGALARILLHYVRTWDAVAANRPDKLVANSKFIVRRIRKTYRRESQVIYPPVDTEYFTPGSGPREDFYLAASRLVPYKRLDLIAETFRQMPDKKLVIIGDGPELPRIKPFLGENVVWLGYQPSEILRDHFRRCRAFVFAAMEDFGIMPLEAQACGAPVIAFGAGGSRETVRGPERPPQTGVFFAEQTVPALREALLAFEASQIQPAACRQHAEQFSIPRFRAEIQAYVQTAWEAFQAEG